MSNQISIECEKRISHIEQTLYDESSGIEAKVRQHDKYFYMVAGGWGFVGVVWATVQVILGMNK